LGGGYSPFCLRSITLDLNKHELQIGCLKNHHSPMIFLDYFDNVRAPMVPGGLGTQISPFFEVLKN